jgi:Na+-translocating ferredoxin:NAD+ oxidoreductase RnfD subunit
VSVHVPATPPHALGVAIRGTRYPLVLPSVRDPRLHLAAVIVSLQVLGQVAFEFRLSIAQILISIGTCALLEVAIVARRQRMIVWPASALLTGNGVAFILRVPGTEHGDWWSMNGWWIFAGTAAVSLLSKYVIQWRGAHVFNPSNFGLVLCFLALGPEQADPLDFWWGPMSPSLALALAIIVVGGVVILSRLHLLAMAVSFWLVFAAAVAVVAATGHSMTARWHLGPVDGFHFWLILAFSPEILVFLFFMLTDPKTVPAGRKARVAFAGSVALLAALLVAFAPTEFWAKVGVLAALAIVCLARPALAFMPSIGSRPRRLAALSAAGLVAYGSALVAVGLETRPASAAPQHAAPVARLPRVVIAPSRGVDSRLDRRTAMRIGADLQSRASTSRLRRITLWLEARSDQFPTIMARLEGGARTDTVKVELSPSGYRAVRVEP